MNPSGENCLARKTEAARRLQILLAAATAAALLSACAGWTPPASSGTPAPAETGVSAPAGQDSAGVQVFPLQNPAVKELLADASSAESVGDYGKAAVLLERALRIQPRDPEILQSMAEVQLQNRDYEQALNFAVRSYDSGPRVGEICSRNWRTIGAAREHMGDRAGSAEAADRAAQCVSTPPERL
jgi:tetratricopeptide (TPR) repeat protein